MSSVSVFFSEEFCSLLKDASPELQGMVQKAIDAECNKKKAKQEEKPTLKRKLKAESSPKAEAEEEEPQAKKRKKQWILLDFTVKAIEQHNRLMQDAQVKMNTNLARIHQLASEIKEM